MKTVSILLSMLQDQGKNKEAKQMNRRALEGGEKVLGKEHSDKLTSVYGLAYLYHQCKHYDAASKLYERACYWYKRTLDPIHPTTDACYDHVSKTVQDTLSTSIADCTNSSSSKFFSYPYCLDARPRGCSRNISLATLAKLCFREQREVNHVPVRTRTVYVLRIML